MANKLWEVSQTNAFSTTLNGGVAISDDSIVITDATGLQYPGILVIDRVNSVGVATPTVREYISYTGISTDTLTGVTRGLGGSNAQAHSSGAIVEEVFSVTHWGDLIDYLQTSHDSAGNVVISSTATIAIARIFSRLDVSGASLTGISNLNPSWIINAAASSVSAYASYPLAMPVGGSFKWLSVAINGTASGANYVFDVNRNGSSIFDAGTRPTIVAGGTYVSTASIAAPDFNPGDMFWVDIDAMGANPVSVTVQANAQ